jgi:SAM-dependent methyltransferase
MRNLGWKVVGVEPDEQAVEMAQKNFGLYVHRGTLEQVGFSDNTMDAIVMHHTMEHFGDPIGALNECRRILKPSGRLIILTPNFKSLGHRFFKKAWFHLDSPRHLYLFSPSNLVFCAEKARLRVLAIKTTARTAYLVWAASQLMRRYGVIPAEFLKKQAFYLHLQGLPFQTVEYGLCWVRDGGEEILLIATK